MVEITKFLFDRRFDRPFEPPRADWESEQPVEPDPPEPEEPPPPPPPSFSQEELEAARTQAFDAGHTQGLDEAAAATGRMASQAMSEAARALEELTTSYSGVVTQVSADAARLVEMIARKMLPVSADSSVIAEIAALVESVLPSVLDEPRLVVRVNPDVLDMIRAHLEPLASSMGYEGRLMIAPDPALDRPDCRVEWTDGGVERDTRRLWSEIGEVIARHSGSSAGADREAGDEGRTAVGAPEAAVDGRLQTGATSTESAIPLGKPVNTDADIAAEPRGQGPLLRGNDQSFPFPRRKSPFPSVGPVPEPGTSAEDEGAGPPEPPQRLPPRSPGDVAFPRAASAPRPARVGPARPE